MGLSRMAVRVGVLAVVVVAVVGFGLYKLFGASSYQLKIVMPTANGLTSGGRVEIAGRQVGNITGLAVDNGQAVVTVAIDSADAPLHDGTTARASWDSLIGARYLEILPGKAANAVIASGHLVTSPTESVELDDVLAALDPKTRANLDGLIGQLRTTLTGHESDLDATLRDSGPAFQELAAVLQAVGTDGPNLRTLITRLNQLVGTLTARQTSLANTVSNVDSFTGAVAGQQQQLNAGLGQLPSTIQIAQQTLGKVPAAVDATVPLLTDLLPAVQQLPSVAHNLSPVLSQLRPTVAALEPTLAAAQTLLQDTPALLDSAHGVVPGVTQALHNLSPAIAFLRPYTPDLVGWLSEWGSAFADYDSQGHYLHTLLQASASSVHDNPGIVPPGQYIDTAPKPGDAAGEPWTDANGSPMR